MHQTWNIITSMSPYEYDREELRKTTAVQMSLVSWRLQCMCEHEFNLAVLMPVKPFLLCRSYIGVCAAFAVRDDMCAVRRRLFHFIWAVFCNLQPVTSTNMAMLVNDSTVLQYCCLTTLIRHYHELYVSLVAYQSRDSCVRIDYTLKPCRAYNYHTLIFPFSNLISTTFHYNSAARPKTYGCRPNVWTVNAAADSPVSFRNRGIMIVQRVRQLQQRQYWRHHRSSLNRPHQYAASRSRRSLFAAYDALLISRTV